MYLISSFATFSTHFRNFNTSFVEIFIISGALLDFACGKFLNEERKKKEKKKIIINKNKLKNLLEK